MPHFNKLSEDYTPEVEGRFNSFITTQFDDSLSVEMQMRSIINWAIDNFELMDKSYNDFTEYIIQGNLDPFIEFLNDLIEYMNEFVDTFDTKFQDEILFNLQKWNDDGTLETLINESLDTKYHEMDERLTTQLAQSTQQISDEVNATNLRVDNLVIPISPENVNVEVTDAHNSIVKNKNFPSLKDRLEESENDFAQHESDYMRQVYYSEYVPLTNKVKNGDFKNGTTNWEMGEGVTSFDVINGVAKVSVNGLSNINQRLPERVQGNIYYIATLCKTDLPYVGLYSGGDVINKQYHSGGGEWERVSTLYNPPSTLGYWDIGIGGHYNTPAGVFECTNFIIVNLSECYGLGNEPSIETFEKTIDKYLNGWFNETVENYVNIKTELNTLNDDNENIKTELIENKNKVLQNTNDIELLKTNDPVNQNDGITSSKEVYPVMFGVNMNNEQDITKSYQDVPRPVGWLYYHPTSYDLLYSKGTPDNMKFLCKWDKTVTWNGISTPDQYAPYITKDGDIIFVWRGDLLGIMSTHPDSRQNPIIYPSGDWENPKEIKIVGQKPTAWLQNCGADYMYNDDIFMFAEYTRPHHVNANIWRVTKPFDDPSNWNTVKTETLSGSNTIGFKHFHTVQYDTFSGQIYATSGDDSDASKIYVSDDKGLTFQVALEGDRKFTRLLNFIFVESGVYWASDDYNHWFLYAPRLPDNTIDFTAIQSVYSLVGYAPTYVSALIEEPYGILLLDRWDGVMEDNKIVVHFWDIETSTMHQLKTIYSVDDSLEVGFRCEACNYYQSRGSDEIVIGFGNPHNNLAVLGNNGISNATRINNLSLRVTKDGDAFDLKIKAYADIS